MKNIILGCNENNLSQEKNNNFWLYINITFSKVQYKPNIEIKAILNLA